MAMITTNSGAGPTTLFEIDGVTAFDPAQIDSKIIDKGGFVSAVDGKCED
jgi:hypothetical protein